jgi:PAS domain-containing protein
LFLAGANPFPSLDLTPFAFTITGAAFSWGLLRFHLLDIAPVAYSVVVEGMSDVVITLDRQSRIIGLNPAAQRMIGRRRREAIGQLVGELVPAWPGPAEHSPEMPTIATEIDFGAGEARRSFSAASRSCTISPSAHVWKRRCEAKSYYSRIWWPSRGRPPPTRR